MGIYLNSKSAHMLFQEDVSMTYFVDKTAILNELVPIVELRKNASGKMEVVRGRDPKYICVTRPRRFGKTTIANMLAAFLGKGVDSSDLFDDLNVAGYPWYREHLNNHNVIFIRFNEMSDEVTTYAQYISRIKRQLNMDLRKAYPDAEIEKEDAVWDAMNRILEYCDSGRFIFVLDEWDYIYHQKFVTDDDKEAFTKFLSLLLKDKAYVEMVYMTGILPISKYSSGSELNMFFEFTMALQEKYSKYFGFTEEEVDALYEKYLKLETDPKVTRDELRLWYNGYQTVSGRRLYNPRSIIGALSYNQVHSYWTESGPYDDRTVPQK